MGVADGGLKQKPVFGCKVVQRKCKQLLFQPIIGRWCRLHKSFIGGVLKRWLQFRCETACAHGANQLVSCGSIHHIQIRNLGSNTFDKLGLGVVVEDCTCKQKLGIS